MPAEPTDDEILEIPRDIVDAMVAHSLRESPLECCGILCGVLPRVSLIYPLRNQLQSETGYNAEPEDLIAAQRDYHRRGCEILAIYHSHPRTDALPSRTDLAKNYHGPLPRIIISLEGETPDVRIWRLDPDSYVALTWQIIEPSDSSAVP
jgi:proteasome lid subunit RPN8/RPN11